MKRGVIEILASSITLGISATLLLLTPQHVGEKMLRSTSTSFLPYILPIVSLSILTLLSAGWLIQTCISKEDRMNKTILLFEKSKIRVIVTLIILFFGCYLVNIVGFIASSVIMIGLLLVYFGLRNWILILGLSLATSVFIYVFFELLLKVPLPEGIIFLGRE